MAPNLNIVTCGLGIKILTHLLMMFIKRFWFHADIPHTTANDVAPMKDQRPKKIMPKLLMLYSLNVLGPVRMLRAQIRENGS